MAESNNLSLHSSQRGYLLEIPILLVMVIVVASIILPKLPPQGQKILIALAAIPILFFLYYMIVIPGWMPNDTSRLKPPWNLVVFLLIAIPIVVVAVLIVFA